MTDLILRDRMEKTNVSTIYITMEEGKDPRIVTVSGNAVDVISMACGVVITTLKQAPGLLAPTKRAMLKKMRRLERDRRERWEWLLERVLFYVVGTCAIWGALSMFLSFMGWLMRVLGI